MDTTRQRHGQRRHFSNAFKRRAVEETLEGRESVSVVARRHDLNTNLLFTWRRRYQEGLLSEADKDEQTALVPIQVSPASSEAVRSKLLEDAELDLVLSGGHRIRVRGAVDPDVLRAALEVLCR